MARIRLKFKTICNITGIDRPQGLILLVDTTNTRQLAVPCDERTLNEFVRRLEKPSTRGRMMPEALWRLMKQQGDCMLEILIDGLLPSGNYNALLIQSHTLSSQPIDITDAVLLSYASDGEIPIYIEENFYRHQSTEYVPGQNSVQVPLDVMNLDTLQRSLDKAVKDENYELAALLQKEMTSRKKMRETQHREAEEIKRLRKRRQDGGQQNTESNSVDNDKK